MTGRADVLTRIPELRRLLVVQQGVTTRAQLAAVGLAQHHVDSQLRARRWRQVAPDVVVLHNGPLERSARMWSAVLSAPRGVVLASWTALELRGLRGWQRPEIHLVVARGERWVRHDGVVVHESRRHTPDDVRRRGGLPVHTASRAAVDAAAWSPSPRTAVGLLAAVVQQGLTTPAGLRRALETAGQVRHCRTMRLSVADIEGGADSLAEIDLGRLCRTAGLPEPDRQDRRRDTTGRQRFLDAVWLMADGRHLVVEVDGVGHIDVDRWYDDLLRTAEIPGLTDDVVVRLPAIALRTEPDRVIAILRRHLR